MAYYVETIDMTPEQFIAIAPNPKQRDTALHAAKAQAGHLAKPSPLHADVAAARVKVGGEVRDDSGDTIVIPDNGLVALDGHTRRYLHQAGLLELPQQLRVRIFEVDNLAGAAELYDHFDNSGTTKGAADEVQSAYRLNRIQPSSQLLHSGAGLPAAIRIAEGYANGTVVPARTRDELKELVRDWVEEIKILDSAQMRKADLPGVYLPAALLMVQRDGTKPLEFFNEVRNNRGVMLEGEFDGVYAAATFLKSAEWVKIKQTMSAPDRRNIASAVLLHAYEAWCDRAMMTRYPRGRNIIQQFNPFRQIAAISAAAA